MQPDPPAAAAPDLAGKTVGRFSIQSRLGGGGMGEVYLAEDTGLKRRVALKRVTMELRTSVKARERLWKEAECASRLNDPHIAAVYDVLEGGGEVFLVMEYVEGETLRQRLARPLGLEEFLSIATQCAAALAAAHQADLLHRDIKPENIMLTPAGQVKMLDFGVARELPAAGCGTTVDRRETATFSGTLAYMAPEVLDEKEGDARADIFSLGVVFYEALAGTNPFRRNGFLETCNAILHEEPPPLGETRSNVPAGLAQVISKMLSKNREERYATAADLAVDLRALSRSQKPEDVPSRHIPWKFLVPGIVFIFSLGLAATLSPVRRHVKGWLGIASVPPQKQLAVLQFRSVDDSAEAAPFTAGLSDTLTAKLTQLTSDRSLQVVPATEIQNRHVTTIEQARSDFGVNLVLEGSLAKSGDLVRVNCNLVDARTRRQLRADSITVPATDPFAVQDRVVNSVVHMLELEVQPEQLQILAMHGTQVPAAYSLYLEGTGYLENYDRPENIESAISVFQQSLALDPNFALAYAGLGSAYWKKYLNSNEKQWVEHSRESCEHALTLDSRLAAAHVCLGTLYTGTGSYERAAEEFERAVRVEPTEDAAYRGLADAYERLGKFAEAEKGYERAIELRPGYWAGYNWLGGFYYDQARYADAERMFQKVVMLVPDSFRGYSNLAAVLTVEGRYADAIEALEHSISIRPSPAAYSNLGTAYFYLRRYGDARRTYEEALKLNDKDYVVWWNLGDAGYWGSGGLEQAAVAYRRAIALAQQSLQLNARDARALSIMAVCEARLGEKTPALDALKRALQLSPGDAELEFRAALVYKQLGDSSQALAWLEKAVAAGFSRRMISDSPDFDSLHADARFIRLLEAQ